MVTFAEIKESVKHLSEEELEELRMLLQKQKEEELINVVEAARKESEEGKTISFSNPDDMKDYLEKIANEKD